VRRGRVAARVASGRCRWLQLLYALPERGPNDESGQQDPTASHASAVHFQLAVLCRAAQVSANSAEAIIRNRLTAFNTGSHPRGMRP